MAARLSDERLLDALTEMFRTHGYEGTSLAMISEKTGLQKSSLYHRFPGGKEQMAYAVLEAAVASLAGHVLAPLRGTGSVRTRVRKTARRISELYCDGRKACLLDTLSVGVPLQEGVSELLKRAHDLWIESFSAIAREAGMTPKSAQLRASEALVRLQGALVVSRIGGDTGAFDKMIAGLPDLLSKPQK